MAYIDIPCMARRRLSEYSPLSYARTATHACHTRLGCNVNGLHSTHSCAGETLEIVSDI